MKILVIVVTFNGLKWLERCLGSVRASETPADLYVWDNDSTDGSADWVQGHFPEAKLLRSADNLGFAYMRAGWGGRAIYKQTVKLPCAKYRLEYWSININPSASKGKNLSKVTCRKDTWPDETGFNSTEWTKHEIEFTPTAEFTIQLGFESEGGSGSNPFLCVDGIKLYKIDEADPIDLLRSDFQDAVAECEELQAANPSARIYNDASKADMNYMNHQQQRGPGAGMPNMKIMSAMQKQSAMSDSLKHPERLMQQLFNDQHWVYLNVTTGQLMSKIADIALNMQSHDGDAELLELFTPQELHDLWISNNLYWYLMYSNAPQTDGKQPWNQKYLLQNIIETADTVTKPQVSLRFGHDTVVLPLLCMMDIDGSAVQVEDLNELENSFRSYQLIPTGCNVQLVFYRPKKNKDGEKLVKVLFNERESHLPIATDTWPYYKWKDVREYYLNKLAEHK